ncbi:MAG: bifunctional DNA-formamidopyrimidine glycosylase/DNA-(apurinic or apyrimidinic site) lyase [Verrucomicrobia bacterium]|nr:MAG: bifunctional DNA-formamidopyrimidine glycosylase/DNA-(apurinic or apyrimidinic site) lyase [Verrucomicrobiota bacterium]
MPELPEVETVVRDLRAAGVAGRCIRRVEVLHPSVVVGPADKFAASLKNRKIAAVERRAKFIVFRLADGELLTLHLRMTGQLHLMREARSDKHDHLRLTLDDGRTLVYHDPRRFGRWKLARNAAEAFHHLGPEPLDGKLSPTDFAERLRRHRRQLKPLLLDQTFLAGLGNIYVDESLWAAKLHPQRLASTVKPEVAKILFAAIRRILNAAIRQRGTTLGLGEGNFASPHQTRGRYLTRLQAYGRGGEPCLRCGTPIKRTTVGQRGTHFCPACQRKR